MGIWLPAWANGSVPVRFHPDPLILDERNADFGGLSLLQCNIGILNPGNASTGALIFNAVDNLPAARGRPS